MNTPKINRRLFSILVLLIISFGLLIHTYINNYKYQMNLLFKHQELMQIKKHLKIYDLNKNNTYNFDCVKTAEIFVKITICIHNLKNDIYISKNLKSNGVWELDMLTLFMKMLNWNNNIKVFDIGANLGLYCLFAAKFGRKCVAVEPFYDNVIRLHKSAQIENITDNIVLVTNGISDTRGVLHHLSKNEQNIGGQSLHKTEDIETLDLDEYLKDKFNSISIKFDDLITILPEDFTEAILKMDIEDSEINAFKKAAEIFERVKIHAVFMEWGRKRIFLTKEISHILDFMFDRDFEVKDTNLKPLKRKDWEYWPWDIVWIHKDFNFKLHPSI